MSRRANVIRHGANHACGGSDPIPGICDIVPATGGAGFYATLLGLNGVCSLLGYWRLGEASGATFADSNPNLAAVNLAKTATGTALSYHQAGGLDATQDDGAVTFNGRGNTVVGGTAGDYLTASTSRFNFNTTGSTYSVVAWVKPKAGGSASLEGIVGSQAAGSLNETGWVMYVSWSGATCTLFFGRQLDGSATFFGTSTVITANVWSFIVGTYDGVTTRIYVNGALAATGGTATAVGGSGGITVGRSMTYSAAGGVGQWYFGGSLDELSIFGCALDAASVLSLYAAGTNPYLSGYVLTVQPDGSYAWSAPTLQVTF